MTQDFIFAHDVILDPATAKVVALVRNGGVWRDGTKIAVLIGPQMYDLNGNLLGKLAAGAGSLPLSFKNLLKGKSTHAALAGDAANRSSHRSSRSRSRSTLAHQVALVGPLVEGRR